MIRPKPRRAKAAAKRAAKPERAQQHRPQHFGSDVPQAFTLAEAAILLSVSKPTMRRLIKRELINPIRVLRHFLFSDEELRRFLREGQ